MSPSSQRSAIVLTIAFILLAPVGCGRKSPPTESESSFGEVQQPPKTAEGLRQWREARREKERQREREREQMRMVEGLSEVFRVEDVEARVAIGDLEGDGTLRVVAAVARYDGYSRQDEWELRVYDLEGALLTSWPVGTERVASVSLVDLDEDSKAEVLVGAWTGDRNIVSTLYDTDGTVLAKYEPHRGGVRVIDMDADGRSEVVRLGLQGTDLQSLRSTLQLASADGSLHWQRGDLGLLKRVRVGDLGGDGTVEIAVEQQLPPRFSILDADGNVIRTYGRKDVPGLVGLVALADVTSTEPGDELLVCTRTRGTDELAMVALTADGQQLFRAPLGKGVGGDPQWVVAAGGVVALTTFDGTLLVLDGNGRQIAKARGYGYRPLAGAADQQGKPVFAVVGVVKRVLVVYTLDTQ